VTVCRRRQGRPFTVVPSPCAAHLCPQTSIHRYRVVHRSFRVAAAMPPPRRAADYAVIVKERGVMRSATAAAMPRRKHARCAQSVTNETAIEVSHARSHFSRHCPARRAAPHDAARCLAYADSARERTTTKCKQNNAAIPAMARYGMRRTMPRRREISARAPPSPYAEAPAPAPPAPHC